MKKKNILKVHSAKGSCAAHVTRVDFNGEALYQFIYKGEAYDIVFNRFLPIGGTSLSFLTVSHSKLNRASKLKNLLIKNQFKAIIALET